MKVFAITEVLDPAYYGVRSYSRVPGLRFYSSSDDVSGVELGPFLRLPPSLLGSIRRFAIEYNVRSSCYPAGYAQAVFHRMSIVWEENPHPGYCRYSSDDDGFPSYRAHGNYHAQPDPPCYG